MKAERLIELFERVGEAPGAVGRLRDLVFHLAIRGRLTSDSVYRGIGRAEDGNASIDDGLSEADVPAGWKLAPLASLGAIRGGGTPSKSKPEYWDGDVPWVSPKDMKSDHISDSGLHISRAATEETPARILPPGCVLFVVRGMILAHSFPVALTKTSVAINQDMKGLELADPRLGEFVLLALKALRDCVLKRVQRSSHGTCRLEGDSYLELRIPVPPLAEQKRILKRVAELMVLCDQLASAQTKREQRRDRLVTASLQRLREPVGDGAVFREHAAFHLRHMGRMTTRVEHVRELRAAVLAMAVTGKLSYQDPQDGDAEDLLEEIARTRTVYTNVKQLDVSSQPEPLFELPANWTWTVVDRLRADVENAITDGPFGAELKTEHYVERSPYRVIRLQNIGRTDFRSQFESYVDAERFARLRKHRVVAGDLVVSGLVDPFMRCCLLPDTIGNAVVKADCYRLAVDQRISSQYVLYYLNSPVAQRFAKQHHHGMTLTRIGLGNFRLLPIPVPPLGEQRRIVAEVQSLMRLCNRMEEAIVYSDAKKVAMLDGAIHQAVSPY